MNEYNTDEKKGSKDRFLDATRKTLHTASFKASQYKRLVQKKIDLSSLHKKISSIHSELGKLVDDYREQEASDILHKEDIILLFEKLDSLKNAAALLEEEIETIRVETPDVQEPEKEATTSPVEDFTPTASGDTEAKSEEDSDSKPSV